MTILQSFPANRGQSGMKNSVEFWRSQARFETSVRAGQRSSILANRALGFGLNRKHRDDLTRIESLWRGRAESYLRKKPNLRASWVAVDPGLQATILDYAADVWPALAKSFDDHMAKMALRAAETWPVWSGFSRCLLTLEYSLVERSKFSGVFESRAPYTVFIRPPMSKGKGGHTLAAAVEAIYQADASGQVWQISIRANGRRRVRPISEQALNALDVRPIVRPARAEKVKVYRSFFHGRPVAGAPLRAYRGGREFLIGAGGEVEESDPVTGLRRPATDHPWRDKVLVPGKGLPAVIRAETLVEIERVAKRRPRRMSPRR